MEEEAGRASFRDYLYALYRYKWIIAISALLGCGAAYAFVSSIEPVYVVQGSIWVQGNSGPPASQGPIQSQGLLPADSWMDLLQSFALLEPVVLEQKLYVDPVNPDDLPLFESVELGSRLAPGRYVLSVSEDGRGVVLRGTDAEAVVEQARVGTPIGQALGIVWTPPPQALTPGRQVEFTLSTPRDAARRLQSELLTRLQSRGSFIQIQLSGRNPDRMADVVNSLMDRHVELAGELKSRTLDEEYNILAEQLRYAETELADAEAALENFRVRTITLPSDRPIQAGLEMTRDPVFDEFLQMRVDRDMIRRDRMRLESVAAEIPDSGLRIEAIEVIPSVSSSTQLQTALSGLVNARAERGALIERYTEAHPSVQEVTQRIATLEEDRIPALLSQLVQQLALEESLLTEQIEDSGAELTQIPPRMIEEGRLSRRVAIAENLYTELESRFQTTNLARASSVPDVTILDRAVPPSSPASAQQMGMAFAILFGFVGVGGAAAILLDRLDSRLRTPDEVLSTFGLTVLGAVPRIQNKSGRRGPAGIKNVAQVYEAFRELRTSVTYAYGRAGPIVLTVSSPGMAEGKTTITTNLGVAFSDLGRRTLIIDADTRRGDLHHFLGGTRKPGITDFLRSSASLDDVIQGTVHKGLDFIALGTQVSNSPELLSSSGMGRLMAALRHEYDVILLDSPPLGAGADALVLATITGHMILVVRSGATDREFTAAKLEPLGRLPVRMLGAVLNDYEPSRLSKGYQYYGSYLPGYEAGAEEGREEEERQPSLAATSE